MKIALVWASNDTEKYWNKILKDLIKKGHTVYPINPKEDYIENIKAYKSLSEVNDDFEIVNFVVKPEITLQILQSNLQLIKQKTIWCQPGASDDLVIDFLKNNFTHYITDSCIMIQDIKKS